MGTIKKEFGVQPINFSKAAGVKHRNRLPAYAAFVDRILHPLSVGKVDEAKKLATAFRWTWD